MTLKLVDMLNRLPFLVTKGQYLKFRKKFENDSNCYVNEIEYMKALETWIDNVCIIILDKEGII